MLSIAAVTPTNCLLVSEGVIPSGAAFQAERGISRGIETLLARSLRPLEKTRAFRMTPRLRSPLLTKVQVPPGLYNR